MRQTSNLPVCVITGASSGFGLLTSIHLAKAGYRVAATMRNLDQRERLCDAAEQEGVADRIDCHRLDVNHLDDINKTIQEVMERYERIDVLVNNAGFATGGFVEELTPADWVEQMQTNFFGTVHMSRAVLPVMRQQRSGKIINISSISGRLGIPGYAPYAASKFAVEGFSEALRLEMLPFGIHVVLVEPASYQTDIWRKGLERIHIAEHSPFRDFLESILNESRRSAEQARHPQEVAQQIVRIVQSRYPKLRYVMGKGARFLVAAKAVLPWKVLERAILRRLLGR